MQSRYSVILFSFILLVSGFLLFLLFFNFPDSIFWAENQFKIGFFAVCLFFLFLSLNFWALKKSSQYQVKRIYQQFPELKSSDKKEFDIKSFTKKIKLLTESKSEEIDFLKVREEYRREFLGNVSHELKTPLFSMQGYLLTLIEGGKEDEKILERYLDRINKSVERLAFIINDLDTIAEVERDYKLNYTEINLVALTQEVFDLLDLKAKSAQVKLIFDQNYSNPVRVVADIKRIEQVLINLIVNGIKHAGRTTVEVGFKINKDDTTIFVKDGGRGIGKEHLGRIFERFYRADKSRNREKGGSGLGLAIVKHILEAHQSKINVSSELNKGCVFEFNLKNS